MSSLQFVTDATNDVVLAAFCGAMFFLITYTIMSPWWKHAIGTTLVMLDAGLAASLAPSVLHRFFGLNITQQAFAWYFLSSVTIVGTAVWWRSWVMIRANWDNPRMLRLRELARRILRREDAP